MNSKGFTLIEVIVATFLLAGALIVLSNSWSGSLNAFRKSRHITTVSLLLQKKVTETELRAQNKGVSDVPEEEAGDFGSDFPEFSWKIETKKLEMPDLASILTARDGGAQEIEMTIIRQITEAIENAVKELRVTVVWKRKDQSLEYSITTYLVDEQQKDLLGNLGGGT